MGGGSAGLPPFSAGESGVGGVGTGEDGAGGAPASGGSEPVGAGGAPSGGVGVVAAHGALRVLDGRVVDAFGDPIQLRGMSLFWSQWTSFYNAQAVDVLVDDWGSTVVRAALGVEEGGGYLQDPASNAAKVDIVVQAAIDRGIYVIIDWHDHHAQDHLAQATSYFQDVATRYGGYPNVIFEVYNEPMNTGWSTVKTYAESVISTIRAAGTDNLIIVGTPNWSQDVDVAAGDPITTDDNVAYTLHFYANTHKQWLRDKASVALSAGLALFVTEWGTCDASGNGSVNAGETSAWLTFLGDRGISWANWALNDKAEACSALRPGASPTGPWPDGDLTESGALVKPWIP
jgi:endoglucanase